MNSVIHGYRRTVRMRLTYWPQNRICCSGRTCLAAAAVAAAYDAAAHACTSRRRTSQIPNSRTVIAPSRRTGCLATVAANFASVISHLFLRKTKQICIHGHKYLRYVCEYLRKIRRERTQQHSLFLNLFSEFFATCHCHQKNLPSTQPGTWCLLSE